jgi:hypothetical protein
MRTGWVILVAVSGLIGGVLLAFVQLLVSGIIVVATLTVPSLARLGLVFRGGSVSLVSVALLIATSVVGCGQPRRLPEPPHTPEPPASITDPTDPAQRSNVLSYARGLTFAYDSARVYSRGTGPVDTTADPYGPRGIYHGQFDENLLNTFGDSGTIAPEENIHNTTVSELRRGRIQLRIKITAGPGRSAAQVYASLGLYPGVSYVWVDRPDSVRRTVRRIIIAADTIVRADTLTIIVVHGKSWNQAVARWTPGQCWTCEVAGWCH